MSHLKYLFGASTGDLLRVSRTQNSLIYVHNTHVHTYILLSWLQREQHGLAISKLAQKIREVL